MILERCTTLGTWDPVGEFGCEDCGLCEEMDVLHEHNAQTFEEFETTARAMDLEVGRYRIMSEGREVHRFTVGERN